MSKALMIKGSDFSANKCGTVHYLVTVPCESIALDQTELTLNTLDSQTLTATVSPADCTDPVTWTSSDTDVVTVDNGVLTIDGLGTATVTATCGEQSATCSVTVDNLKISTGFLWGTVTKSGSNDYSTANVPSNYSKICYADTIPLDSARRRFSRNSAFVGDFNLTGMPLPKGVGQVRVKSTNVSGMYYVLFYDSAQSANNQPVVIKMIGANTPNAPSNGAVDNTFDVTDGADSFSVSFTMKTTYSASDDVDAIAEQLGLEIYLMAGQD